MVDEGACVVVADLDSESAQAVSEELGGPDKAVAVTVDVTDEAQIAAAFKAALLAFGGVDLVVNNAGISISKPLLETSARTGTSSTTSWPAVPSWSHVRPPGR